MKYLWRNCVNITVQLILPSVVCEIRNIEVCVHSVHTKTLSPSRLGTAVSVHGVLKLSYIELHITE